MTSEFIKNQNLIIIIANVVLFLLLFVILLFIYKRKNTSYVKNRIKKTFPIRSLVIMILSATGATFIISSIAFSKLTSTLFFLSVLLIIPSIIESEVARIKNEEVFDDVILYCHNTAMLLKNSHNCFDSINIVKDDLTTELKDDVIALLKAMQESKQDVQIAMEQIEKNYQYSCIKQLNIIIMFMFYENSQINDVLLDDYQNGLEKLQTAVKINKDKRKVLRIQYIFISVACIISYKYFLNNIDPSLLMFSENKTFLMINTVFIFLIFICLYSANRYFTENGTKE